MHGRNVMRLGHQPVQRFFAVFHLHVAVKSFHIHQNSVHPKTPVAPEELNIIIK